VAYKNETIFQHFGHTEQFKVYDVEDRKIKKEEIISTGGQGHGALATFLKQASVDLLICGGIGGGAKTALEEAGITLYAGVQGDADEAVKAWIDGALEQNTEATCNHHHEHHQGEDGHCGSHGCGRHQEEHSHECRHGNC
jgi:predicted Fe-Mo cluster-binding NifX family protein